MGETYCFPLLLLKLPQQVIRLPEHQQVTIWIECMSDKNEKRIQEMLKLRPFARLLLNLQPVHILFHSGNLKVEQINWRVFQHYIKLSGFIIYFLLKEMICIEVIFGQIRKQPELSATELLPLVLCSLSEQMFLSNRI